MFRQRICTRAEDGTALIIEALSSNLMTQEATLAELSGYLPPFGWSLRKLSVTKKNLFQVELGNAHSLNRFESNYGLAVAEHLLGKVAIHAACIVIGQRVLVFPARSGSGKSTLAKHALEQGCEVLSDEYSVIDEQTLELTPWPRPIRTIDQNGKISRTPLRQISDRYLPSDLYELRFSEKTNGLQISPMSQSESALAIVSNAVCASQSPKKTFEVASELARAVESYSGNRGDVGEAFAELAQMCNNP